MAAKDEGIEDLTSFAVDVIRGSGEQALSYYGKGKPNIKFDEALVTEAELCVTEFFQEQLGARFPEHQLFENNQKDQGYTHDEKRHLWIFDALDGVANFQAGIPVWGVSIALLENFWPIFGVFYMPATNDLFHARAGGKAYRNKEEIHISNQESINDESLLLTYSRFHNHYHSTFPGKIRDLGCTGAHICYVAMGRAEGAIIANESYQDLAAVRVIIEAAGGKTYRMDGSEFSLDEYLDGARINEQLLVASPHILTEIREYLQKTA